MNSDPITSAPPDQVAVVGPMSDDAGACLTRQEMAAISLRRPAHLFPPRSSSALGMLAMASMFMYHPPMGESLLAGPPPRPLFPPARSYPPGPCEVCGKPNVRSGRERGVYRCSEHQA
jgi:hypothetical protein